MGLANFSTPRRILLEVGPGHTLASLATQHPARASDQLSFSSFRSAKGESSELCDVVTTLGRMWMAGIPCDWPAISGGQRRRRIPLPTYPFERKRYWIEAKNSRTSVPWSEVSTRIKADVHAHFSNDATDGQSTDDKAVSKQSIDLRGGDGAELTDLQKVLVSVWREVLGFEEIGIDENFFALGGDSLVGVQVVSRLRMTLRMDVPPSCIFEAPTISELASYLIEHEPTPGQVEKTASILIQIDGMTAEEMLQASTKEGLS